MKFEKSIKKIFTSKYFLYFLLVLAVTNLLGYLMMKNFNAIAVFLIVGVLMNYFSKNMSVILLVCLTVTNLLMSRSFFKEGMENGDKSASTDGSKKSAPGKPSKKVADNKPAPAKKKDSSTNVITGPAQNEEDKTEDAPVGKDAISTVNGAKPDYAQTMTENYKNLNNMLEPESIQNLTKETMALMSEQKKLFESMQSMSPLLAQAKDMLAGMDMNNLQGLGDMVKNFAAAKP
uniref:Uncharacterized protein n=1 Tax=viral metagenome TaxID=1070528 RepID=A0A6C0F2V5_9ZZZZ